MRIKQKRELTTVLVCSVCTVVVCVLSFKVRLVLFKAIVPLGMAAVTVSVMSVVALNHVLENVKFASFRHCKRL